MSVSLTVELTFQFLPNAYGRYCVVQTVEIVFIWEHVHLRPRSFEMRPRSFETAFIRDRVHSRPPLFETAFIRDRLYSRPRLFETTFIRDHVYSRPRLFETTFIRDHVYLRPRLFETTFIWDLFVWDHIHLKHGRLTPCSF